MISKLWAKILLAALLMGGVSCRGNSPERTVRLSIYNRTSFNIRVTGRIGIIRQTITLDMGRHWSGTIPHGFIGREIRIVITKLAEKKMND